MQKKGQAAMEFLMTYGWAILAAIIAIGVLAYFGVFNPGRFVSDTYTVNAPFNARSGSVSTTQVQLELLNGAGETVSVSNIAITNCNTAGAAFTINQPTGNTTVYPIPCTVTPPLVSGETFRGDVTITYTTSGTTISKRSTGSITARVS